MRRVLTSVLALALLARASASAATTFEYSGPAATIARGNAIKFSVKTAGKATIRISGTPETNAKGLLTGRTGAWLDVHATQTADGLLSWSAPKDFLIRSRRARRPTTPSTARSSSATSS